MTSPTRRSHRSGALARSGPSGPVLQKLLEQINSGDNTPSVLQDRHSPYDTSIMWSRSINSPRFQPSSVWVNGGSAAEEARMKLRALDEARQRRHSSSGLPSNLAHGVSMLNQHRTNNGADRFLLPASVLQVERPKPVFDKMAFARSAAWATCDEVSPTTKRPEHLLRLKRDRSATPSPKLLMKRARTSPPLTRASADRMRSSSETDNTIIRGGRSIVASSLLAKDPPSLNKRMRYTCSDSIGCSEQAPTTTRISSFRSITSLHQSPFIPSTPQVLLADMDGSASPALTPTWMRPLHLVDDEKLIYMNVHGEDWRDHSLCLHCFRLHGSFHQILQHGCEVCGEEEVLEGHYWEPSYRE